MKRVSFFFIKTLAKVDSANKASDPSTYLHTNGALKTMHLLYFLHIKTTARRFSVDNKTFDFNKFRAELHARVKRASVDPYLRKYGNLPI